MIVIYAARDFNSWFARFHAGRPGAPKRYQLQLMLLGFGLTVWNVYSSYCVRSTVKAYYGNINGFKRS